MRSFKDTKGVLWVACSECERGGNGSDKDKCACGGNCKRFNSTGCFSGQLIEKFAGEGEIMDAKNYIYLKNKVERYNKLELLKEHLEEVQGLLVKDHDIKIQVDGESVNCISLSEKLPFRVQIDEHEELMREIKDNLIDAIGMKIIEIEEKMKDL